MNSVSGSHYTFVVMSRGILLDRKEESIMVINPIVTDEKGRGNDIFSSNLENRIVYLTGEVTDEMAASVVAQLLYLASRGNEDIQLYINSPGGSVSAGMAIYDTMQHITPDVVTICMGRAASMGAVILSGGARGKRYVLPHAEVMIHQPSGGMEGQATELEIAAEHIRETKKYLNELLAENCGKQYRQLVKDTDRDHWMRAAEAVEYGVADRIMGRED